MGFLENAVIDIAHGDVLEVLKQMPSDTFDALMCDPPYGLSFMGKRWDYDVPSVDVWREALRVLKPGAPLLAFGGTRTYHRMVVNIEDGGFEIRDQIAWIYAQGFPKSMCVGCRCKNERREEDTERAVRSMQSANLSQTVSTTKTEGQVLQPIVQKQGAQEHGSSRTESQTGDGAQPRVEGGCHIQKGERELHRSEVREVPDRVSFDVSQGRVCDGASPSDGEGNRTGADTDGGRAPSRSQHVEQRDRKPGIVSEQRRAQTGGGVGETCQACGKVIGWGSYGTALKPAQEPICVARKPLEGTMAANVVAHGVGGLNIDGTRIASEPYTINTFDNGAKPFGDAVGEPYTSKEQIGRWPANVILDEEAGAVMDAQSGNRPGMSGGGKHKADYPGGMFGAIDSPGTARADTGGASRFFYCCKASRKERELGCDALPARAGFEAVEREEGSAGLDNPRAGAGRTAGKVRNFHPTVKPLDLCRYLATLIRPPSAEAMLLIPYSGSGSEMIGAMLAGWSNVIGIEGEEEYVRIAEARIRHWQK